MALLGAVLDGLALSVGNLLVALLFVIALIVALIDWQHYIIPNSCCVLVGALGLGIQIVRLIGAFNSKVLATLSSWGLMYHIVLNLPSPQVCLALAVLALVGGYALERAKRALTGTFGMGMGDIKYIAAWAAVLGWYIFPAIALACLFGAAFALAHRARTFAFGPWLSLAFICTLVFLLFIPANQIFYV